MPVALGQALETVTFIKRHRGCVDVPDTDHESIRPDRARVILARRHESVPHAAPPRLRRDSQEAELDFSVAANLPKR